MMCTLPTATQAMPMLAMAATRCPQQPGRCPPQPSGWPAVAGQTVIYVHLTEHTLATGTGVLRVEGIGRLLAIQVSG